VNGYKDLIAWQHGMKLVLSVYRVTKAFPKEETYGLTSQIRRSAVSIPSNIAEGQGRLSKGGMRQFLGQARGSLLELETQVQIARELGYVSKTDGDGLLKSSSELGRILNGLIEYSRTQR
jgi:four helix bundle protein